MIRETSIEAFEKIKANGLLSERRFQVYEILFEHGPMIGSEVARIFKARHGITSPSETIRNRITELRDMGVVKEIGKTIDPNTSMRVIQWDVTAHLPIKFERSKEYKCPTCHGTGKVFTEQGRLF